MLFFPIENQGFLYTSIVGFFKSVNREKRISKNRLNTSPGFLVFVLKTLILIYFSVIVESKEKLKFDQRQ